jgi:hypothetical protein
MLNRHRGSPRRGVQRGQSILEFALVVPILLIVFVAIADFGRIFATGIELEAATRNAAEAAANQYLAAPPGGAPLNAPAPAGSSAYYDPLHIVAADVVCAELRELPNTNFDSGTSTCPDMPVVMVCVHDAQDTGCSSVASPGSGIVPAGCNGMTSPPTSAQVGTMRWVEVRTCYHFTSTLALPLFSFGDFWLQKTASFTIPCYFAIGNPSECG